MVGAIAIVFLSASASAEPVGKVDFNRQIRPLLADRCFKCHGPDTSKRKADLRFDIGQEGLKAGVVVPGDPASSKLVKKITAENPDERMPPADSKLSLNEDEKKLLVRWISEGGVFEPHWAFQPVADHPVPDVADTGHWVKNSIDAFILERLAAEALSPSAEAGRQTLIRRVTMDLTGLPPTLEDIDAFIADTSPEAYEKVVGRLLASPAYGEHMAKDWLDVARYADTYGYQDDKESKLWPWRDWVIKAFNENLPYDQFATWQVAGDLLENPTQEQRVATAFNRLHRQTNEGGSINEEFRVEYVADRMQTFSTAFLGLTMECCRCHDHKFDPIAQREYYSMFSFFNNIDESGVYSFFTDAIPSPSVLLYTDETRAKHDTLVKAMADAEAGLTRVQTEADSRFQAWRGNPSSGASFIAPVVKLSFNQIADGKTFNAATPDHAAAVASDVKNVDGVHGAAAQFHGEDSVTIKDLAAFDRSDPFTLAVWVKPDADVTKGVIVHRCVAEIDAASRGFEVMLQDGHPVFSLIHFWPGNAIRVVGDAVIQPGVWTHLAVTYDGSSKAAGTHIYVNGIPAKLNVIRDCLVKTIRYERETPSLTLAARMRDVGFKGAMDDFLVFDQELTSLEIEAMVNDVDPRGYAQGVAAKSEDESALKQYFLNRMDEPFQQARVALHDARKAESDLIETVPAIAAMEEMPQPRPTFILARGAYDHPTDPVTPATPAHIMPMADNLPKNRLGLAEWMVDPKNPLTARVETNRLWQHFFGRGIVPTQEDFGNQGQSPSHPELLDFLAHRFVESAWNVKDMCKLIVMSATYRQSSEAKPEILQRDPDNVLLARSPSYRRTAEEIRDAALFASNLMVNTVGGPSVKPYQPAGIWEESTSVKYVADTGPGLYRRSMYTFWKRAVPPPSMLTFDATTREACVARREITTTPMQALVLLNDPQYVEAARVLAENVLARYTSVNDDALVEIFRRVTSHRPSRAELDVLRQTCDEQLHYFQKQPKVAEDYVSVGAHARDKEDPATLAAVTAVAQLAMNFDDFQMKR